RKIVAAHLNHELRGPESDADEAFVRALVEQAKDRVAATLEVCTERLDVRARAQHGNLEDVARQLRYEWLSCVALDHGLHWVATGHTADDQAETVLHRLLRGAGLKGLRGIASRRGLTSGVTLIRPLLGVSRSDVVQYLQAEQQDFREDSSNLDSAF